MLKRNWLLLIFIIPGLLSAFVLADRRYKLEIANRNVELILDYQELQNVALSESMALSDVLSSFRQAGVTGIAITEQTLEDLASTGQIRFRATLYNNEPCTEVIIPDSTLAKRVWEALLKRNYLHTHFANKPTCFVIKATPETLNTIGIGLPPEAINLTRQCGFDVVARLQNHPAITTKAIDSAAKELRQEGISRLICAGDEVIGFRGLLSHAAKQLEKNSLIYGSIEFAKQKGDTIMCKELEGNFIRAHSIPYTEMAGMAPSAAIERFARAVKERNIRLCYIRLIESSGQSDIDKNVQFVSSIRKAIEKAGYKIGTARPFGTSSQPIILLLLMALSIASAGIILLDSIVTLPGIFKYGILILTFAAFAGLIASSELGKQLVALKAAIIFPTLGVVGVIGPRFACKTNEKSPALTATKLFIGTSIFTLIGAFHIAGMLGNRLYMVKVEQFIGIKLAHIVPLFVVIFVMAAGLPMINEPLGRVWAKVRENLHSVMAHPLFVWHAIAVSFALIILLIALMRTGNDAAIGVSTVELKFRAILDKILFVRPRTKEFLIGHPAMFLGIALLVSRRRAWGLPLIALGTLGQVSMLNTFCHIHTPLALSAMRTINGLVLGFVLGLAAWLIFGKRNTGVSRKLTSDN